MLVLSSFCHEHIYSKYIVSVQQLTVLYEVFLCLWEGVLESGRWGKCLNVKKHEVHYLLHPFERSIGKAHKKRVLLFIYVWGWVFWEANFSVTVRVVAELFPKSFWRLLIVGAVIVVWSWAHRQGCEVDAIISKTIKAPRGQAPFPREEQQSVGSEFPIRIYWSWCKYNTSYTWSGVRSQGCNWM